MKKKALLVSFVLIPLMLACSSESSSKLSLTRNGDISGLDAAAATYEDVGVTQDASSMLDFFSAGGAGLFLFTSTNCSHCTDWRSAFVSFAIAHQLYVTLFEKTSTNSARYYENLKAVQTYYQTESIDGATPSLYAGNKDRFVCLSYGENSSSYLENAIKGNISYQSNLTAFSKFSLFNSALEDSPSTPVFLCDSREDSAATFYRDFASAFVTSEKSFFLLDASRMDDSQTTLFLSYFQLADYSPILRINGVSYDLSIESDNEKAKDAVALYYR